MRANKGQGCIYQRGKLWWISFSHRCEKQFESSRSEKRSDAVKLLRKRLSEIDGGRFAPAARVTTVSTILDLVVADYKAQGRRSLPRCQLSVKQLKEAMGAVLARDVSYSQLNTYVAECRGRGWQPATIWLNLAILRRAYSLALKEGLLSGRPVFPVVAVDNARQGFFERADFERVRGELHSETSRNVVTFAYLTGWRTRSEILPLTWDRVDFGAGVVRLDVRQSKNGAGRTFPFDAMQELRDVLGRQKLAADAFEAMQGWRPRFVFFHRDGDRGGAEAGSLVRTFDRAWRAARKRAGIPGHILHDFRRTAVRNLVRAGVSESVAMQLCGHKTRKVFDRYSIVSERDLREGVSKLAAQSEREAATSNG
jgi:integrase